MNKTVLVRMMQRPTDVDANNYCLRWRKPATARSRDHSAAAGGGSSFSLRPSSTPSRSHATSNGAVAVAWLSSLVSREYTATQYALLSGVYALSRSVLSGQAGFLADPALQAQVAQPLALAFGVSSGVGAQAGLITAVVAGWK